VGVSDLLDDSVESVDLVSGVFDNTGGAVRFNKAVLSLDYISVAVLGLGLDVSGVGVLHSVVKSVLGVGLKDGNTSLE